VEVELLQKRSVQKRFAEFYKLYAGDFQQDIPIYLDLAAKFPGPVLEVGCATGRVMAHLASAGHEILGVDSSRDALEVAKRHLRPWDDRARIQDFDLRTHILPERFHVAFVTLFFFNNLIDIEEQRLFLRHLRSCMRSPGIVMLDLFCPLIRVRPEIAGAWREFERVCGPHRVRLRDKREMLTPLLERRTQLFQVDDEEEAEVVLHRRYVPPSQAARLLEEAGFEHPRWMLSYDLSTVGPARDEDNPQRPFQLIANA
jgi:SAM-dependent methyltransferase